MNPSHAGNHQWNTRDTNNPLHSPLLHPVQSPGAGARYGSLANHLNSNDLSGGLPPQHQSSQAQAARFTELLNQLRIVTSTSSSSPVIILQASLDHITSLQGRCSQLEQEYKKALDAFQKLVAVEQEAERNRSLIAGLLSNGASAATSPLIVASPTMDPLSDRDGLSRHSTPHSLTRSATHPVSLMHHSSTLSRQSSSTQDEMSDYSGDVTGSVSPQTRRAPLNTAVPTAASTPAFATISTNGSIIGCSQSFAELFGFSYLFSRSISGIYNLFTLVPESAVQIRQAIDSIRQSSFSSHHSCAMVAQELYSHDGFIPNAKFI